MYVHIVNVWSWIWENVLTTEISVGPQQNPLERWGYRWAVCGATKYGFPGYAVKILDMRKGCI